MATCIVSPSSYLVDILFNFEGGLQLKQTFGNFRKQSNPITLS